jgi:hypothetical protein
MSPAGTAPGSDRTGGLLDQALRLAQRGQLKLAMPLFVAAIRAAPDDAEAAVQAGKAALRLGRPALAVQLLEECVTRHPAERRAVGHLMIARLRQGEWRAADALCRRVLELDPGNVQALATLGYLAPVLGAAGDAAGWLRAAIAAEERAGRRRIDALGARLLVGDYAGGWGLLHPDSPHPVPAPWVVPREPVWRGEPLPDPTVCLHNFGGLGDTLLLARYVPLVAARAARVVVVAPPALDRVLRSVEGLGGVVRAVEEMGSSTRYLNALQLPAVFGTTMHTVPVRFPYLNAPEEGPRLPPPGAGLRAGLVWAGNPDDWTDADRSVPRPELLAPLLGVAGVEWVSLQVGPRAAWAAELGIAAPPELRDFGDTAHVLAQLDLLVTVDTSVANLALAMGVPTWVMPPTYPDFRWGAPGEPSPWYPAARLFRRAHTDEWQGVVGCVAGALAAAVRDPSELRAE